MSCIVHIESTTNVCSTALSEDGVCLMDEVDINGPSHAVKLAPFVKEAVSFADSHAIPIDAVAISSGPGSYTGLRIGHSLAKGLCYGRRLKLISVSTLELMTVPLLLFHEGLPEDALFCPMIDARRMEVYTATYGRDLKTIKDIRAEIIDEYSFEDILKEHKCVFFGNGSEKCKGVITHKNAIFVDGIYPQAKYMFPLAEKALAEGRTEDIAYYEPFYLKEFMTTKSKKLF